MAKREPEGIIIYTCMWINLYKNVATFLNLACIVAIGLKAIRVCFYGSIPILVSFWNGQYSVVKLKCKAGY